MATTCPGPTGERTPRRHKGAADAGRGRTPLRRALRTLDAEARRAGGFRRLFPLAGGGEYLLLFAQHRPLNAALVRELDARCARAAQAEDEAEEEAADAEDAAGGAQGRGGTAGAGPRGAGPGGVECLSICLWMFKGLWMCCIALQHVYAGRR